MMKPTPRKVVRWVQRSRDVMPLRGYLEEIGWVRSAATQRPVDADGQPLPWMTYPMIDLLASRVQSRFRVFEYGAGFSTLWWASRVQSVTSVEHDADWVASLEVPDNVHLIHAERGSPDYIRAALGGRYEVVAIDGRDRVACAEVAATAVTEDGVIVWDDTDRTEYRPGIDALRSAGWRQLDLPGLKPTVSWTTTSGVFYRDGNCFGL